MRISTSMIFDQGVSAINGQTSSMLNLQQQVATGRRILTPADDPVGAARALEVTQAAAVNAQLKQNHDNATSALGLEEAQLSSASDLIARVRELAVQAGDGALTTNDRKALGVELRARFDELMGLANSTDGVGQHIFSGFMGTTKPFGGTVDNILQTPGNDVIYEGDDGQRRLQVSASRYIEVSDSGNDVFLRVRNGNGSFVTNYPTDPVTFLATNTGTGVIDGGNVTNPAVWDALPTKNYSINFSIDNTAIPPVTYYDIIDNDPGTVAAPNANFGNSLLTGAAPTLPPTAATGQRVYTSGQPIVLSQAAAPANVPPLLAFDLGSSVLIEGAPAAGDSFSIAPSSSQSIFATLAKLIGGVENGSTATPAGAAQLSNDIGFALTNLDQATDNILRVRAEIGSRMNEIDSLANIAEDLNLQYQQTLSKIQDLDYAKTLSDLTRKQIDLEAAQKSFISTSGLSLFNYIR